MWHGNVAGEILWFYVAFFDIFAGHFIRVYQPQYVEDACFMRDVYEPTILDYVS
jgi:hypothetical protein